MSGEWDGANVCDEWDVNFQVSGTRYCFLSTRREQTSESTKDSNECDGVEISRERDTVMLKSTMCQLRLVRLDMSRG